MNMHVGTAPRPYGADREPWEFEFIEEPEALPEPEDQDDEEEEASSRDEAGIDFIGITTIVAKGIDDELE